MKQTLSFAVAAIQVFSQYAAAFGTTKVHLSATHEWSLNSDVLDWNLFKCDPDSTFVSASVPGQVHLDLLSSGILNQDPLYRQNELEYAWVAQSCWNYQTENFQLDGIDTSSTEPLFLRLDGVDTSAQIFLNGNLVGSTQNAYRSHTLKVDRSFLSEKNNQLNIVIESALDATERNSTAYPYKVPAILYYNTWSEPSTRNFLRKSPKDFGWDWGPSFVPSGVTGNVTFVENPFGRLHGVVINQELSDDLKNATLTVSAQINEIPHYNGEARAEVYVNGELKLTKTFRVYPDRQVSSSTDQFTSPMINLGKIDLNDVSLWWPRGFGEQNLYSVEVKYYGDADVSEPQSLVRQVGLRKAELVQDQVESNSNQPKAENRLFYFKVNDVPIFAKGANFIPIDLFENRVTSEDRQYIIQTAIQSNYNMIRVWGGGIYQPTEFYDECDRNGLMVWQEFMFACAMYPRNQDFLHEVALEVQETALRLASHPSIFVFGGNNENEVGFDWYQESRNNRDLFVADYVKLYGDTVFGTLQKVLGTNFYQSQNLWVDSSPSNGLLSVEPYVKRWTAASTASAGDQHFYDYAMDCEDDGSFPASRFISEFGFQSQPSFNTYKSVLEEGDYFKDSAILQYRQRHEGGNGEMEAQIQKHFQIPEASQTPGEQGFSDYLYLTGIQQSRCYETAFNKWRRGRSLDAHTMGILYWQMNDIWQGPSWASMEFGGRWKPLHYAVKRAYAPVASNLLKTSDGTLQLWIVNDQRTDVEIEFVIEPISWSGSLAKGSKDSNLANSVIKVPANSSILAAQIPIDSLLQKLSLRGCDENNCFIKATSKVSETGEQLFNSHLFLSTMKDAELVSNPSISTSNFKQVSEKKVQFDIKVSETSPFLFMELADVKSIETFKVFGSNAGWFSDNNFVAEANQVYTIQYDSFSSNITVEDIQTRLSARVLQSIYSDADYETSPKQLTVEQLLQITQQ